MQSKATSVDQYIDSLPEDRKKVMIQLRKVIKKNIPKGFEECISYGMIGYVVPHKLYPKGYHCSPELPLPFLGVGSQKSHIGIYHMGVYANADLFKWFTNEFKKHSSKKLDMGKSCIRFKKPEDVTIDLIGELVSKMTPQKWIEVYEKAFQKKS